MPSHHRAVVAALAACSAVGGAPALGAINIPTVPIGNPGNAPDSTGFGSVAYTYNIGTTEVTNAQYAAFLNAVGRTEANPNDLYNQNMAGPFGGITRSGVQGSYTYSTIAGRENLPVQYVSFWDGCRFANWLHNGQPTGPRSNATTEDGAYTLTSSAISGNTVARNAGAQWALPSENEWYKAAYHQPVTQGGDADSYWLFPNSSNTLLSTAANFNNAYGLNALPVGSFTPNFYGVQDMGGNVWEWNEWANIAASSRGIRGGFWGSDPVVLRSTFRSGDATNVEEAGFGFRVVQIPGPSVAALLALGGAMANRRRRA